MKKKFLALTLLSGAMLVGTCLTGCGEETPNPDPVVDKVTGVAIAGPLSVRLGQTITLTADCLGSEDDRVTWESLNTSVATIDSNGVVKGVSVGTATIKATSVKDPSFSSEWEVRVTGETSNSIKLIIEESDDIRVDENGVYQIPGGKTFRVNYELGNSNATKPDSIAYTFSYSDGSQATGQDCIIEHQEDGSALVTFNKVFTGGVISVSASYSASVEGSIRDAAMVASYDKNADNVTRLDKILDGIQEQELNSLVRATHTYKTENLTQVSKFNSFEDSTYTSITETNSDNETTVTNAYSVIDKDENAFYFFSYDEEKRIDQMFANQTFIHEAAYQYEEYAKLPNFIINDLPVYGFSSILNSIANEASYRGDSAFGDFLARGNATYTFTESSAKVETQYEDNIGYFVGIKFEIGFNSNYQLTSFNYKYSLGSSADKLEVVFEESGSDFVYETKGADTLNKIDINDYYITNFDLEYVDNYEEIAGSSDGERYDISGSETDEDGVTTYSLTYNHSLPLRIANIAPTTGSTLIDIASVNVTNPETGSRDIVIYEDGIAVINPPKKADGEYVETTETVTFTTRGGASKTAKIVWTAPEVGGIVFDCPNDTETNTTHVFDDVRLYQETEYFWLNTESDDTSYEFDMRITSGDADGLSLVPHDGDTDKEVPEGAYTIEALKTGTYTFYFYIVGHENEFKTETFTLEVLEPISADEYKTNLIGKTYEYNTGTMEYSLKFENETTMVLTMPTVSGDREEGDTPSESGEVSVNIKYQISDGRVTVLSDAADGVNQIFNSNDSYYESVYAGDIDISEDYRNVTLQLRLRSDSSNDPHNYNYNSVTFTLPADTSDLAGNSYKGEEFLNGYGSRCTLTVTFTNDSEGTFVLTNNNNQSVVAEYSFKYTSNADTNSVELSEVTVTNSTLKNLSFASARMGSNDTLNISFTVALASGYSYQTTFSVDLKNPL